MASSEMLRHYRHTDGAIRFDTPALCAAFEAVVHGWPATDGAGPEGVFATVAPAASGGWQINGLRPEPFERTFTEVSAICDLIVELNWSRLRHRAELMCLHAAALEIDGRLVIFPSGRRAGKSTLTAELARRGHRVFSDDILAVSTDADGAPLGLATGIAPRLRQPLPPAAPAAFASWVASDPGPSDRQYKYLLSAPVAGFDAAAPIGAIVTLGIEDTATAPCLTPVEPAPMLETLIHQNFGRFVHSGRALTVFDGLVRSVPCRQMSYSDLGAAADAIEALAAEVRAAPAPHASPSGGAARGGVVPDGAAQLHAQGGARLRAGAPYRQHPDLTVTEIDGQAYVADARGVGIFHLNAGFLPIWRLLEEPMTQADLTAILREAYGAEAPCSLAVDVAGAMEALSHAGLIEPVDATG